MLMTYAQHGLIMAGLLASALSAGFFYTYSISVMPGLAAADPSSAIRAMQGINADRHLMMPDAHTSQAAGFLPARPRIQSLRVR
jgi:uncharacterized membrane protein